MIFGEAPRQMFFCNQKKKRFCRSANSVPFWAAKWRKPPGDSEFPPDPLKRPSRAKKIGLLILAAFPIFVSLYYYDFVPPPFRGTLSSPGRLKLLASNGKWCSQFLGSRHKLQRNAASLLLLVCLWRATAVFEDWRLTGKIRPYQLPLLTGEFRNAWC